MTTASGTSKPSWAAKKKALEADDASIALAYVPKQGEEEARRAFDATRRIRDQGPLVREIADLHGPVIPVTERAIESGRRFNHRAYVSRGRRRGARQIEADGPGHLAAVRRARGLDLAECITQDRRRRRSG